MVVVNYFYCLIFLHDYVYFGLTFVDIKVIFSPPVVLLKIY